MYKTWFVTGAAGFIGSNLCEYLLRLGYCVYALDNYSTGKRENIDRVNRVSNGEFNFIEGNILDYELVKGLCLKSDVVVHLAAQGSVQKSFVDIKNNNLQNIDGFTNLLVASGESNVYKFIYASSCAVYGNTDKSSISEKYCPSPLSPYASSKLLNDFLGINLSSRYSSMDITGLRFFNIFGPFQDPNGDYAAVIPKWIDACINGSTLNIFGDGSATRDFCYVGNICDTILDIVSLDSGLSSGVYNIGSGKSTSLNELHDLIVKLLSKHNVRVSLEKPKYLPWRDGDIVHSLSNVDLAKNTLNFSPKVNLSDGIDNILSIQYYL